MAVESHGWSAPAVSSQATVTDLSEPSGALNPAALLDPMQSIPEEEATGTSVGPAAPSANDVVPPAEGLKHVDPSLPPITRCVTTLTGTFSAGRSALSARPFAYWQGLRDTLAVSPDPEEGHYVERLWAHIMLGPHAALCVRDGVIRA